MKKIEGQEEITEKNDAQEIERAETEKKVKRILDFAKKNKKITYGNYQQNRWKEYLMLWKKWVLILVKMTI